MKRLFPLFLALFSLLAFASCVDEEEFDDSPSGNFEALWKIIDERYCFFDYKNKEYGLDWDAVHDKYRVRVNDRMTSDQLFEVMADMLAELRDGHVNLSRAADFARYWSWQEDYPANFSDSLLRRYLGTDYKIAAGLQYRVLDDNIGYVRYESFSDAIGEGNIDEVISRLMLCRGLIIDIRGNGGGAGLPFSNSLPNGWAVRFSACPMYDADGQPTEFGIAPDHSVSLTDADFARGRDTIIEFARALLSR